MEKLLSLFRKKQEEILLSMVEAPCTTLEDYKKRVGQHQGLQIAIDELVHLMRDVDD